MRSRLALLFVVLALVSVMSACTSAAPPAPQQLPPPADGS